MAVKNPNEAVRIAITLSTQTEEYLGALVKIGTYGNSPTECATYVLRRGLDDLLRAGILELPRGR